MSNRIDVCFAKLKTSGEKAFIPFITAGDPDLATTVKLVQAMAAAGADIIELGVPYSEPVADGPVIQAATQRSLKTGTTLTEILKTVRVIRQTATVPLVLMSYFNPILQYRLDKFVADAVAAGVDGVIVPDLPVEEAQPLAQAAAAAGLHLIPLVAPTTTDNRLVAIAAQAQGFIYCVSITGVTGARQQVNTEIAALTRRVQAVSTLPVAVGFGVSTPEQAAVVAKQCDAVIVGSAIVKVIEQSPGTAVSQVAEMVKEFKAAL